MDKIPTTPKECDQRPPHTSTPGVFHALVNDRPFLTTRVSAVSCLRAELKGPCEHPIWKIHAVGKVCYRRTIIGFFIDDSLQPGTYDLVANEGLTAVYHLTPKQLAQVYHSRDFESGSVRLLECNAQTGRIRGHFEFAIPAVGFRVSEGMFDLVCQREHPPRS